MWDGRDRRGQAMIELSVFGAIFLTILAALISYGLRYNYLVNAHQTAFRRALHIASDPNQGGVTYALIRDKHIPDPADPFGLGTVLPAVSSASVTRTNRMDAQAADAEGLPTTVMQMSTGLRNGVETLAPPLVYKSAGFRWETSTTGGYTKNQVRKYRLIYGDVMLANASRQPITDYDADEDLVPAVRIVDSCSGEVISYDDCYDQAVKLVNNSTAPTSPCMVDCAVVRDANAGVEGMEDYDCAVICGATALNPPNQNPLLAYNSAIGGPWYADGWYISPADETHSRPYYVFPRLDQVFAPTHNKQMGMDSRMTQRETKSTTLSKAESSEGMGDGSAEIQTQEDVAWSKTIERKFTYHENLRPDGSERRDAYLTGGGTPAARDLSLGATTTRTFTDNVSEQWRQTWTTQK